jgi:Leucine-rich repeat (LRR) protein
LRRHIDTFFYWIDGAGWYDKAEYVGEATGDVTVPAGKRLGLIVSQEACRDLSPLSKLRPDALFMLSVPDVDMGGPTSGDRGMHHIASLSGLKVLQLGNTNISGKGLGLIKQMRSLEHLGLTKPSNGALAHIAELPELKGLTIVANPQSRQDKLTNEGLRHLAKMTSLEELNLGGRRVGDAGLVHLSKLPLLRYLMLQGENFTDDGMVHVGNVSSLKILHLGHVRQITDVSLAHLSKLGDLENLSLHWNDNISDNGMVQLKKMRSLKKLDIGHAQVTDAGLAHLKEIKTLEYLNLPSKGISDKGLAYLGELTKLKHLHIPRASYVDPSMDKDYYTDEGLKELAKLRSLEELYIGSTGITDVGMSHIAGLTNLKELHIFTGSITEKGLAKLMALKSMKKLSLHYAKGMTASRLSQLNGLSGLTDLDVRKIEKGDAPLDISGLRSLEQLSISLKGETAFGDDDLVCLSKLERLRGVQLYPHAFSDAGIAHLAGLKDLEGLSIGGPEMTNKGLSYLSNMRKLNHLTITDGDLSDKGLRHLEGLKGLTYLNITSENAFSNAALQRLRVQLPNCHFFKVMP